MSEVEEALARQVLYGGDLVTNLLESAPWVEEGRLVRVLATNQGLAPAPAGALPTASAATLRLVPADLAQRHAIYPLEERPGELFLAVADPLPSEVESDLAFALGVNIIQLVAPLARVRQAIARDYGVQLDHRFATLLAHLDSSAPGQRGRRTTARALRLPRPDSLPPEAYPPMGLSATPASTATAQFDQSLLRREARRETKPSSTPATSPGAERAAAEVPDLDTGPATTPSADASALVTAPSSSTAPRNPTPLVPSAVVPVGPARGASPPPPARAASTAPDAAPQVAAQEGARRSTLPTPANPSAHEQLAELARMSQPPAPERASRRPRRGPYTAAMAKEDLERADSRQAVMSALLDFSAQYLEYAALFTVQGDLAGGWAARGPGTDTAAISRIGIPLDLPSALAEARQAGSWQLVALSNTGIDGSLARDLGRPQGQLVLLVPIMVRSRCVMLLYGDHGQDSVELEAVGDVIAFAPLVTRALERLILQRKRAMRRTGAIHAALEGMPNPLVKPQGTVPSAQERAEALAHVLAGERQYTGPVDDPEIPTPAVLPQVRASWTRPRTPEPAEVASGDPEAPSRPASEPPEIAVTTTELEEHWADGEERGVPLAPPSRSVHEDPHPLRRGHDSMESGLPSVIVDVDRDVQTLIAWLLAGNEDAARQLVKMGENAVTALVAAFPGPITVDPHRHRGETVQPSRCGPVLDVLARMGRVVVPGLVARCTDPEAEVRSWSVRLLGELRGPAAARAIGRRFSDHDPEVRAAALAGARMLQRDAESRASLRDLLVHGAQDGHAPIPARRAMLQALADVGDGTAVPMLIPLLCDPHSEIVESAQQALANLTRQEHGTDIGRWTEWWDMNGKRHRIEWLIDALTHDSLWVRAAAGEELKSITKEYFGYYEDLPRRERSQAQQRYREWWEERGRTIFVTD